MFGKWATTLRRQRSLYHSGTFIKLFDEGPYPTWVSLTAQSLLARSGLSKSASKQVSGAHFGGQFVYEEMPITQQILNAAKFFFADSLLSSHFTQNASL